MNTYANYELELLLNQGGMGEVWLARQKDALSTDPQVALKIPRRDAESPEDEIKRRFSREATTLSRLSHPGVVRHLDSCPRSDEPYLVMEYIDGTSLFEHEKRFRLQGQEFPLATAISVAHQLAETLAYLHGEANVIHRDLKPENLMLTDAGHLVLLDFGIALQLDQTRLTRHHQNPGTHSFMAPEQIESPLALSPAVDVYAFGLVVYEMLAGQLPKTKKYRTLRRVRSQLPREWDVILKCCLKPDPAQRYQDGGQLYDAIEKISERQSSRVFGRKTNVQARPKTPGPDVTVQPPRECRDLVLVRKREPYFRLSHKLSVRLAGSFLLTVFVFVAWFLLPDINTKEGPLAKAREALISPAQPTEEPEQGLEFSDVVQSLQTQDMVQAIRQLRQLVRSHPEHDGLRCNLALLLVQEGQSPIAEKVLLEGLKNNPDSTQLSHTLKLVRR